MKYLLDVNALVALAFEPHEFHRRVAGWISKAVTEIATCSISELGFVRILSGVPRYGLSVAEAQSLLLNIKSAKAQKFTLICDDHDLSWLPKWVRTSGHITDGHLLELARANDAVLATLDGKIPGAFLIPEM